MPNDTDSHDQFMPECYAFEQITQKTQEDIHSPSGSRKRFKVLERKETEGGRDHVATWITGFRN